MRQGLVNQIESAAISHNVAFRSDQTATQPP